MSNLFAICIILSCHLVVFLFFGLEKFPFKKMDLLRVCIWKCIWCICMYMIYMCVYVLYMKMDMDTDTNEKGRLFITVHNEEWNARLPRAPLPNYSPLGHPFFWFYRRPAGCQSPSFLLHSWPIGGRVTSTLSRSYPYCLSVEEWAAVTRIRSPTSRV